VHAGPDEHESAQEIRARSEQAKQKKPYKSYVIRIHSNIDQTEKFELKHSAPIYNTGPYLPIPEFTKPPDQTNWTFQGGQQANANFVRKQ
jgi:hypothetical protein